MQNKKNGFTLAEILIVLVFAGVILVYEINILTNKINQYGSLYYNVYNTLRKVGYNMFIDFGTPKGVQREFPKVTKGENGLCERLCEYLNVVEKDKNCDAEGVNKNASNIGDKTLRFKTSNATRFYIDDNVYTTNITKIVKEEVDGVENETEIQEELKYFIVYVDINGEKKPNSVQREGNSKVLPDIVPFAITINHGEVIPMGYPIYDKNYMTAKIQYPACLDENGKTKECEFDKENYSEAMTFYEAISRAWQGRQDVEIPYSNKLTDLLSPNNLAKKFFNGEVQNNVPMTEQDIKLCTNCPEDTTNVAECIDDAVFECKVRIESSDKVRN